ncbi:carboxypeptidase-like regulatory domain-containing protein [Antarcticibacterium flavum]|uniref:Carboxypeptidase-like regulatory domain-containing protein n=1 Tax=Antarcticibacterium flavum TaxID=2058175 RepID=A0A5B7X5A7_9FLAO|nr:MULTISPECIES: DUF5686 family protein [Antarcticibacterium]MCM4159444.1 carboxypeptidase [Antarcticibacterium sp. W02-3]QCY69918.1 carboxypeptidase-like regulatory domain-containing protein [Antarcticibacterium flavum]
MRKELIRRIFISWGIFFLCLSPLSSQTLKLVNDTGEAFPYAMLEFSSGEIDFTDGLGQYRFRKSGEKKEVKITYPAYKPRTIEVLPSQVFLEVRLDPLAPVQSQPNLTPAIEIIKEAIASKAANDPDQKLHSYSHKSYNKLSIERQAKLAQDLRDQDPTGGNSFLSEKVATYLYADGEPKRQVIEGFETAGFDEPAYEVLELELEPPSLYKKEYSIYNTTYAGPLASRALKNYTFTLRDTLVHKGREVYVIHLKPRRPGVISGVEGILFLNTSSLAIQYAKLGIAGKIAMEAVHQYTYLEEEDLWFPEEQTLTLSPGTGGKNISIFGASISLGTVQKTFSPLDILLQPEEIEEDLALLSQTHYYGLDLEKEIAIPKYTAHIKVLDSAVNRSPGFWKENRKIDFSSRDNYTAPQVRRRILRDNTLRKIEINDAIANGFFPVGIWDFKLSRFLHFNNYEGIRLGAGGQTNRNFSENFRLEGYGVYGFKDHRFKYGVGAGALLNQRTGTWWNLRYNDDIREVAVYEYLKDVREFSIFEPRTVNISYYYGYRKLESSLEHRFTPRLDTELQFARNDIFQLRDYAFLHDGEIYRDYTISEATLSFLWQPFSQFISTPEDFSSYKSNYPLITGQVSRSFSGVLGGDFDFTKVGLKVQYARERLDESYTQVTLEGNLGFGDLPLTHAFHAFPNNANRPNILDRFAIAGKISFETMYFNEFFSDRQAAVHLRHQFRPINIGSISNPRLVLVTRHVIGDFQNPAAHQNISFNTLQHGYSESGLELNQILLGFGLSAAYRYGAYHLPTFKENFSLKFTFEFQL